MDESEPSFPLSPDVRPAAPAIPAARRPLAPPGWVLPPAEEQSDAASWDRMTRLGLSPPEGAEPPTDQIPVPAPRPAAGRPELTAGARARPDADQHSYPDDDGYPDEPELESPLTGAGAFGGFRPDESTGRRIGLRAFDPGRRGVRALAAVAVLVIVSVAFLAWRARPRVDTVPPPSFDVAASTDEPGTAEPELPTSASGGGTGPAEVVVAVAGKVRNPGLVRLASGARVADALTAAGGSDPGVDVAMLNLARKVVDGELILVGVTPSPGVTVATGPAPAGTGAAPAGGPVNLNTATLADLDGLPGVGPVLAQRILDARDAQGGFKSVGDLRKVDGIGDARFSQLKDLVTV
jgi:competence protein ComEA